VNVAEVTEESYRAPLSYLFKALPQNRLLRDFLLTARAYGDKHRKTLADASAFFPLKAMVFAVRPFFPVGPLVISA
jgi:hypothetical protein